MQSVTHSEAVDRAPARDAQRWARAVVAVALLLAHRDARADRLRVLILVGDEAQRELAARIEGQTADLDAVVATAEGKLPPDLDGQLGAARAARAGADVVVWFAADEGGGWTAYVLRQDRLLVRRIDVAPGALSRSASIEAVALAVRTAVTGFAASADDDVPRELAEPAPVAVRPWGELCATGLLDGTRAAGQYGAALRGGATRGRLSLGATLGYQPRAAIDGAAASIAVERAQLGAVVGADLLSPPASASRWSLVVELGAGAARFRRTTTATGAGLVATPAAVTWSPLLAPGVRLARRVVSLAWIALQAGADVVLRPPEFGVQRSTGFERLASAWAFQPRAALTLLLDWR